MISWKVIESGCLSVEEVMAKDALLLNQMKANSPPILHFYEWKSPCLTYGYFTKPDHYLDLEAIKYYGLQMSRRPTGGGIIFHLSDFAFSLLVPASHPRFSLNTLDNYAFINQKVAEAITHFTIQSMGKSLQPTLFSMESICLKRECNVFCMAKPTQYDLILEGRKVGGAAQRRTREGLLHQTSLSLLFPPVHILRRALKNHESILMAMEEHTYCLLSEQQAKIQDLQEIRYQLKEILKNFLTTL